MEYRKLISFGKSSYVVSLPKAWVTQNKLKKGDLIYFDEAANNLVLQPRPSSTVEEEKKITINVDGKDLRRIYRELISAYIQNHKTISLVGNDIKGKAKDIQKLIQNLVALEILEQDSKKIIAKDFLNLNDISLDQIIRKMDVITHSMLKDCQEMFTEDNYENIYHRDSDVNKFRFLIFRIIWYGLENPALIYKKLKLNQRDIFNYWWLAYSLEAIADYAKRIARQMREVQLSPKGKKEFIELLGIIETMQAEIMKAYYTKNIEKVHDVLQERYNLIQHCDDFYNRNKTVNGVGYLVYNLKSLITTAHTIGRIVYEGMPG